MTDNEFLTQATARQLVADRLTRADRNQVSRIVRPSRRQRLARGLHRMADALDT